MPHDPRSVVLRYFHELANTGDFAAADEILAPDYLQHNPDSPDGTARGRDGFKIRLNQWRTAFPDILWTVDELIAEGNRVAARWTAAGTHLGELAGIPPTGRRAVLQGITISRIERGRIAEAWVSWDTLNLMRQLGVYRRDTLAKRFPE